MNVHKEEVKEAPPASEDVTKASEEVKVTEDIKEVTESPESSPNEETKETDGWDDWGDGSASSSEDNTDWESWDKDVKKDEKKVKHRTKHAKIRVEDIPSDSTEADEEVHREKKKSHTKETSLWDWSGLNEVVSAVGMFVFIFCYLIF